MPDSLTSPQRRRIEQEYPRKSASQLARELGVERDAVQQYIKELQAAQRRRRERVFKWILALLPFLILAALEAGLHLANYGGEQNLFITADFDPRYWTVNPAAGSRYFLNKTVMPATAYDFFLKQKPANGYRIFVLGESSAAGYPYLYNGTFPRMLLTRLRDYFPERHIEMINLGMPAVHSYTLLDFTRELLNYEPDAMLIYTGHNEFYGALGIGSTESLGPFRGLVRLYLRLQDFRLFCLLRDGIRALRGKGTTKETTLMESMVREQHILLGSALYQKGREIFQENLLDIIGRARQRHVAVVVGELVSNVRDQKPFVSVFNASTDQSRWNEIFSKGEALLSPQHAGDDLTQALNYFQQAAVIDTMPAKLHFAVGRCFEALGRYDEARAAYYRAKDLDALRFRASEDFNRAIHEVCLSQDVPVAPMVAAFEQASPHRLIGENLMLEHLHPNVAGYFLMAKTFGETIRRHGLIAAQWDSARAQPDSVYWAQTGVTPLDEEVARIRLGRLMSGWPFRGNSGDPNNFSYQPKNRLQELAHAFWRGEKTWEEVHVALAEHYEKEKQWDGAIAEYQALALATPFSISPLLRMSDVYLRQKNYPDAERVLRQSMTIEPSAYANKWLGAILLQRGEAPEALGYLQKANQLAPDDLQVLYNLSGAYALAGKSDLARAHVQKLLQRAPDYPGAANLLRQLQ
jgi:tetratricopeptide (TPR) repeat protein